jgi:hypothetical protein
LQAILRPVEIVFKSGKSVGGFGGQVVSRADEFDREAVYSEREQAERRDARDSGSAPQSLRGSASQRAYPEWLFSVTCHSVWGLMIEAGSRRLPLWRDEFYRLNPTLSPKNRSERIPPAVYVCAKRFGRHRFITFPGGDSKSKTDTTNAAQVTDG